MICALDETHDPSASSWVDTANGHADFPLQSLPFGRFTDGGPSTLGVAIGDVILDLRACAESGLLDAAGAPVVAALSQATLNPLMALGAGARRSLRRVLFQLLARNAAATAVTRHMLRKAADCQLLRPADIGDFTDFYAGIHHATNASRRRNPAAANPLNENYKYVPVAYHSRSSSVGASGMVVKRPSGQRKGTEPKPTFGPSRMLDFELELAVWIGPGNDAGEPVVISDAHEHIWGYGLLNDLSARDIQRWETQPLGPFLGKNFGTVVSPWIVTPEALAPFRIAQPKRPEGDPKPLDYLWDDADQAAGALNLDLEVLLRSAKMRDAKTAPHRLARTSTSHLYWTPAQFVAHHTCGGCNLRAGDLFGSGTISGPRLEETGSLNELSESGTKRLALPSGEERTFLEDGDEVHFSARAERSGYAGIGFGPCVARIAG